MDNDDTIQEWIRRAESGDQNAATHLVNQYELELRRYIRFRLKDPRLRVLLDSLDISQSVFGRFFLALGEGRVDVTNPRQLTRLLQTMAINRVRDHARRRSAAKRSGLDDSDGQIPAEEVVDSGPEPAERAMTYEIVDAIRSELNKDECLILDCRIDGRGWGEVAASVGSTPEAVRKRFTRAIDRAAQKLGLN